MITPQKPTRRGDKVALGYTETGKVVKTKPDGTRVVKDKTGKLTKDTNPVKVS